MTIIENKVEEWIPEVGYVWWYPIEPTIEDITNAAVFFNLPATTKVRVELDRSEDKWRLTLKS